MQDILTLGRRSHRLPARYDRSELLVGIVNALWLSALFWFAVAAAF